MISHDQSVWMNCLHENKAGVNEVERERLPETYLYLTELPQL